MKEKTPLRAFDILPSGEMKKAILGDEKTYTKKQWVLAATLPVGARGLVAVDPFYWKPRRENGEVALRAPAGPAQIWVERWTGPGRTPRHAAVRVVLKEGKVRARRSVDTVAIDQGRLMVGCREKLDAWWKVGGPRSKSNVAAWDKKVAQKALRALEKAGFRMSMESDMPSFVDPLEDADIERADAVLAAAGIDETVNTHQHHSREDFEARYDGDSVNVYDREKVPYLVAFHAGWGNGIYRWYRLGDGKRGVLGYECRFDP